MVNFEVGRGKDVPVHAMKAYEGALLILNLVTRWRRTVRITPRHISVE
jgi:hypothetical protein